MTWTIESMGVGGPQGETIAMAGMAHTSLRSASASALSATAHWVGHGDHAWVTERLRLGGWAERQKT
jgi:hypothetical protein